MYLRKHAYIYLFILALSSQQAFAAKIMSIWQNPQTIPALDTFYFDNAAFKTKQLKHALFATQQQRQDNPQQFKLIDVKEHAGITHARYEQYYAGIPIWGTQLLIHQGKQLLATGMIVTDIQQDLKTTQLSMRATDAYRTALEYLQLRYTGHHFSSASNTDSSVFIYIDPNNQRAHLVQALTFFIRDNTTKQLLRPVFLINVNNGEILKYYNNLPTANVGTGPGGNDLTHQENKLLPRRSNHYQFGRVVAGLRSFGTLPVLVNGASCSETTKIANIRSLDNVAVDENIFPINFANEANYPIFTYACSNASLFFNTNDNGFAPVGNSGRLAFSPNNDSFYFATETYNMLRLYLPRIRQPWGNALPIRVYTHVGDLNNAFALSPVDAFQQSLRKPASFPPQIVLGNGGDDSYPLTSSGTVAHELGHIFTSYASRLIYAEQSGGINEAYSDISGVTFDAYLDKRFPWYGFTWAIDPNLALPTGPLAGRATRYMNNPPLDKKSIDNAADFKTGMDVHFSSGVYNKAFYLMVAAYGMDIVNAFQYFSYANLFYWMPSTDFNNGCCGVLQAARDLNKNTDFAKIMKAFAEVNVRCQFSSI